MTNVLADLAVESEAATLLAMRVAGAFDRAAGDPAEAALRRLATAVAKYWVCKRAPAVAAEALECLGGNGYVEESGMPRLYREAPLNSIWEGAGNVNSLDVLRVLARQPEGLAALLDEVAPARAAEPRLDRAAAAVEQELAGAADPAGLQAGARAAGRAAGRAPPGGAAGPPRPPGGGRRLLRLRVVGDHGPRSAPCRPASTWPPSSAGPPPRWAEAGTEPLPGRDGAGTGRSGTTGRDSGTSPWRWGVGRQRAR